MVSETSARRRMRETKLDERIDSPRDVDRGRDRVDGGIVILFFLELRDWEEWQSLF